MAVTKLSEGSGTTKVSLLQRIARRLDDNPYTEALPALTSGATTLAGLTSDATDRWEINDTFDFLDDGTFEAVLIVAAPTATSFPAASLRRGHRGSTDSTHSANAIARKNPAYLAQTMSEVVDQVIRDLWPEIPLVQVENFTPATPVELYYDLDASVERVVSAYQKSTSGVLRIHDRPVRPITYIDETASTTAKTVEIQNVSNSSSLSDLFVLELARLVVGDLDTNQQELVIADACYRLISTRMATVDDDQMRANLQLQAQLFDRQRRELRAQEAERLRRYLPRQNQPTFIPGRHYSEVRPSRGFGRVG